jgi:hypothetical protein
MSETSSVAKKSSAPLILGIIGFALNIPGMLCSAMCAAASEGLTNAQLSNGGMNMGELAEAANRQESIEGMVRWIAIFWVVGFIAAFMGKSSWSHIAGVASMVSGLAMVIQCFSTMNWFGVISGILYFIGGVFAFINKKRV